MDKSYIYSLQAISIEGRVYAHLGKHKRIAWCISYNNDFIDLQYEPNGDLQSYIEKKKKKNTLGLHDRRQFAHQAVEAVIFIHSKNVIHSDLSARQFLVSPNGKDTRLSDFGGSSLQGADAIVMENAAHFLPRDEDAPNTVLSDLFALGSTLYEIFVGRKPYEGVGDGEVQQLFGEEVFPTLEEEIEDEWWRRVIRKCWMCEYEQAVDISGDVSSGLCFRVFWQMIIVGMSSPNSNTTGLDLLVRVSGHRDEMAVVTNISDYYRRTTASVLNPRAQLAWPFNLRNTSLIASLALTTL